jgi:nanoRNase/pAp phosphatase (c-di-AMP/oligoRNAs hydrolase)
LSVHPGDVYLASLSLGDFAAAAALPQHTDGVIDDLKRIAEAQVTVLLREDTPGHWKVSMRSMGRDVASVCRSFGGGGHALAAGCELGGNADEVARRIIEALGADA